MHHGFHSLIKSMTHAISLRQGTKPLLIDGHTLSLAAVNAAARYGIPVLLDSSSEVKARVKRSKATLDDKLRDKKSIYGVSTGYGGSGECLLLRLRPLLINLSKPIPGPTHIMFSEPRSSNTNISGYSPPATTPPCSLLMIHLRQPRCPSHTSAPLWRSGRTLLSEVIPQSAGSSSNALLRF